MEELGGTYRLGLRPRYRFDGIALHRATSHDDSTYDTGADPRPTRDHLEVTAVIARKARPVRFGGVVVVALGSLIGLTGCGATGGSHVSTASPDAPPMSGPTTASFASSAEPIAIVPDSYRIPKSAWSVADFTVTIPEGWAVQ
jgi:hypothetical protein